MKSNVIDVNIWLALVSPHHADYQATLRWYDELAPGEAGLCRFVQISVLRLMCAPAVAGAGVVTAGQAWIGMEQLLADQRVEFIDEPPELTAIWPTLFRYRQPTPKLVNDAYLAAFAIASGRRLVTRDRGFLEFRGLEVELLA